MKGSCDLCGHLGELYRFSKRSSYLVCRQCYNGTIGVPLNIVERKIEDMRCEWCGTRAATVYKGNKKQGIRMCPPCAAEDEDLHEHMGDF